MRLAPLLRFAMNPSRSASTPNRALPFPPRKWRALGEEGDRNKPSFTVMTYNILADCLLLENRYLYNHVPPFVLRWDYRANRLISDIRRLKVCVQLAGLMCIMSEL